MSFLYKNITHIRSKRETQDFKLSLSRNNKAFALDNLWNIIKRKQTKSLIKYLSSVTDSMQVVFFYYTKTMFAISWYKEWLFIKNSSQNYSSKFKTSFQIFSVLFWQPKAKCFHFVREMYVNEFYKFSVTYYFHCFGQETFTFS